MPGFQHQYSELPPGKKATSCWLFSCVFFCSFISFVVIAQPGITSVNFKHLNVDNGLSQGVNNAVYKDSRGYIWISSFDGLNKYNGNGFTVYRENPADSFSVRGTLFLNILEDKQGNIWAGSNHGINKYERMYGRFRHFSVPEKKNDHFLSPFYIDDKDRIWMQSGPDIFFLDQQTNLIKKYCTLPKQGNMIIRMETRELYKKPSRAFAVLNNFPELYQITFNETAEPQISVTSLQQQVSKINSLLPASNETIWLGCSNGLFRYHTALNTLISVKETGPDADVSALVFGKGGILWAGTKNKGLFAADSSSLHIIKWYGHDEADAASLSGKQVLQLYVDPQNILWASVWGKGIDYANLSKPLFAHYLTKEEAAHAGADNFTRSVLSLPTGNIWVATQASGIVVLDKEKEIQRVLKQELPPTVEHLTIDAKGRIWAATFSGIFLMNTEGRILKKITPGIPYTAAAGSYNFILPLKDGRILAASNQGLQLIAEKKETFKISTLKTGKDKDVYLTLYQNTDERLYLSRPFKGFFTGYLKGDTLVDQRDYPSQSTIKCFSFQNDSVTWIGSTNGLLKFNERKQQAEKQYSNADGLGNQYIYSAIPASGNVWLSSNAGIIRFNESKGTFKNYSFADGLQSNEFNTYAYASLPGGELLFGGVNGINGFTPGNLTQQKQPSFLQLIRLMVNDSTWRNEYDPGEIQQLVLPFRQNTVSFEFNIPDYTGSHKNFLFYQLEGYDKNGITGSQQHVIRYANLPAGEYTFIVKVQDAEGNNSGTEKKIRIHILAPWWQTWWFRLALLLLGTGLVVMAARSFYRRRLQKHKMQLEKDLAVEQERIRMARELHDGLGSMLSGIKHSFSALNNEIEMDADRKKRFEYSIEKLDNSITELRAVSHNLFSAELLEEGLDKATKNYCNAVSTTSGIKINVETIFEQPVEMNSQFAFQVFRVIQELVQNIIKHSQATEALVQLSFNEGMLAITVEDNGRGFEQQAAKQQQGIGLKNVESRLKMLHGHLDIKSHPGRGTSVFAEVPYR